MEALKLVTTAARVPMVLIVAGGGDDQDLADHALEPVTRRLLADRSR